MSIYIFYIYSIFVFYAFFIFLFIFDIYLSDAAIYLCFIVSETMTINIYSILFYSILNMASVPLRLTYSLLHRHTRHS